MQERRNTLAREIGLIGENLKLGQQPLQGLYQNIESNLELAKCGDENEQVVSISGNFIRHIFSFDGKCVRSVWIRTDRQRRDQELLRRSSPTDSTYVQRRLHT
jgi:hypothetical protein